MVMLSIGLIPYPTVVTLYDFSSLSIINIKHFEDLLTGILLICNRAQRIIGLKN